MIRLVCQGQAGAGVPTSPPPGAIQEGAGPPEGKKPPANSIVPDVSLQCPVPADMTTPTRGATWSSDAQTPDGHALQGCLRVSDMDTFDSGTIMPTEITKK